MTLTNDFIDDIASSFCEMTSATLAQQNVLVSAMRAIACHAVAETENIRVGGMLADLKRLAQIQQDSKLYK